jgi:hypothetical protein
MPLRTRDSNFSNSGGGTRRRMLLGSMIVNDVQAPFQVTKNHCVDETGPWKINRLIIDKQLDIQHIERKLEPITGRLDINPTTWKEYKSYFPEYLTKITPSHIADNLPSNGVIATEVVARSNPARAAVSLPNFIYELKDLPGMIRDIGMLKLIGQRAFSKAHWNGGVPATPRDVANLQLSYQMGWAPLIGDLANMVQFQSSVDRKVRDLTNLYNNGGLHRTIGKAAPATSTRKERQDRWSFSSRVDSIVTVDSALGDLFTMRESKYTYARKWGTTRWLPDEIGAFTTASIRNLAFRLVFGLNTNPKALWDAFPWTWLIDWFSNFGDFIQTSGLGIHAHASLPCIMYERTTEYQYTPKSVPWGTLGPSTITLVDLKRSIASPGLSVSVPFLTSRQLSILGALAVQRLR